MKTLFVFMVHIYQFYSSSAAYGIRQPSHSEDNVNKGFDVDSVFKKCMALDGDLRTGNFLDPDLLLCLGVKVFAERFRDKQDVKSIFTGVENKMDMQFCKHFQEMRLNLLNNDKSVDLYNIQFRDENTCERACLDVMGNVNPLCSFILLSNRHFNGNSSGSGPSTTLDRGKAPNVDDEVSSSKVDSEQSTKNSPAEAVSNTIPTDHKTKSSDETKVIKEQTPETSDTAVTSDRAKVTLKSGEDKSTVQNTKITPPEQTSQALNSSIPDEDKLHKLKEQMGGTGIGSNKGNQTPSGKGDAQAAASGQATNLDGAAPIQGQNDHLPLGTNSVKNTTDSKKEATGNTADGSNLAIKNGNQGKLGSLTGKNITVEMPKSSEGKKDTPPVARPKPQETNSTGEVNVASKKVVADTAAQKANSISQTTNAVEGKKIVNRPEPQAETETENPPLKDAELQVSSKAITEEIPKNNIEEPETNQSNRKADTNENVETEPQSGRDDTQKTAGEEMQFTDDTGAELETHFSVEAGESFDNTEFTGGGGTGVDYARPGSDVLDTGKNEIDAGKIVIHERYEDDDSHFFAYFMTTMVFCIVGYLVFHNKQKILALALEGRARRGRRRPNTAGYRKLDSNLEEAISSSKSASVTQVIY